MKLGWLRLKSKDKKKNAPDYFFRELDIQFLIHELKDPMGILITVLRSLLEKRENTDLFRLGRRKP